MTIEDQLNEMLKVYEDTTVPETPGNESQNEVDKDIDKQEVVEGDTPTPPVPDKPLTTTDNKSEIESEPGSEPEVKPETEIEKLKREQNEMRQRMDEILSHQTPPKVETVPETVPQPLTIEEQDFIGNADIESILNDPKEFNKLLNKVYQKGIEIAEKRNAEIRTSLPETIRTNVITLETLRKASESFYNENKDLVPFKGAVATVFGEISTQHPDWQYDKLLIESEVETRKRLNLPKQAETTTSSTTPPTNDVPKLPRKGSHQRTTPEAKSTNPVLNQLAAMDAALS